MGRGLCLCVYDNSFVFSLLCSTLLAIISLLVDEMQSDQRSNEVDEIKMLKIFPLHVVSSEMMRHWRK